MSSAKWQPSSPQPHPILLIVGTLEAVENEDLIRVQQQDGQDVVSRAHAALREVRGFVLNINPTS